MDLLYIYLPALVSIWIIVSAFTCPGVSANRDSVPGVVIATLVSPGVVLVTGVEDIFDLALMR